MNQSKRLTIFSMHQRLKKIGLVILSISFLCSISIFLINRRVVHTAAPFLYTSLEKIPSADAVLILGARVYHNKTLSDILKDRTDTALEVYRAGKVKKILVSGDHGQPNYDEVDAVKTYLLAREVPENDIFLDHAGFDTYDSLYRARDIFAAHSLIVTTQNFHLPRAVYIGHTLGLATYGFGADKHHYQQATYAAFREWFARVKAWFNVTFSASPKFLGESIPLTDDGKKSWGE